VRNAFGVFVLLRRVFVFQCATLLGSIDRCACGFVPLRSDIGGFVPLRGQFSIDFQLN
jgi:hypothetical protein